MTRRSLLDVAAAGLPTLGSPAPPIKALIELRLIRLRNGPENQRPRAQEFLNRYAAAARRAGISPLGVFSSVIGEGSPSLLLLKTYPGFAAMERALAKLEADAEYQRAVENWYGGGLPYVRQEAWLLRGFDSVPTVETPPLEGRKPLRVFELRTYESGTFLTLRRKMRMFDEGEIAIFRRLNLLPVFFGETLLGSGMPSLTYMVAHDDLAARERNWRAFANDPEWQKLRVQPGLSDAELVSNISNSIWSPLPFSDIR